MLSLLLYQVLIFCEKKTRYYCIYCILYCKEGEVIRVESRPVTADRRFNTYWAKVAHHSVLIYCPFFATEACYELPKHPKKFMKNRTQNTDAVHVLPPFTPFHFHFRLFFLLFFFILLRRFIAPQQGPLTVLSSLCSIYFILKYH